MNKKFNKFIEEAASKVTECPQGEYYCNKEQKCKKIPKGYRVNSHGWLKPLGGSYYTGAKNGSHNGNGNGNGNGGGHSGGNGNGNGGGNGNGNGGE